MDSEEVKSIINQISSCELKPRQVPMGFTFYPITIYTPGIGVYDKSEIKEVLADGTEVDYLGQIPQEAITDDGKVVGIFIDFDNPPPFLNSEKLKGNKDESPGIWVQAIRVFYCDKSDFGECLSDNSVKEFPSLSDAIKAGMKSYRMYTFWKVMRFIENYSPEDVAKMKDIVDKNMEQKKKIGIDNFEFYRVYRRIFVPLGSAISIISLKKEIVDTESWKFRFSEGLRYYDFSCVVEQLQTLQSGSNASGASGGELEVSPAPFIGGGSSGTAGGTTGSEQSVQSGGNAGGIPGGQTEGQAVQAVPPIPSFLEGSSEETPGQSEGQEVSSEGQTSSSSSGGELAAPPMPSF
jgi:hypothetical protein